MKQARRYMLTINNPFAENEKTKDLYTDIKTFAEYVKSLEHFKYAMFQQEQGEIEHTDHIQMFITFTCGKMFNTIKTYFPTAHIEEIKGTNVQARDYCSKTDTRLPNTEPIEIGLFAEERARTDISNFFEMIDMGVKNNELKKLYPTLYSKNYSHLDKMRQDNIFAEYEEKTRNLTVTYIYGGAGVGKTSYVLNKHGYKNVYRVTNYAHPFDSYHGQAIVCFDEFDSSFKLTDFLNYLDIYPLWLPCRYNDKVACYETVYIISNKPLTDQYKNIQADNKEQYNALLRRIHNIIKIEKDGKQVIEKQNGLIAVNDENMPW